MEDRHSEKKKGIRWGRLLLWICVTAVTVAAIWFLLQLVPKEDENVDLLLEAPVEIDTEPQTETESEFPAESVVPAPPIDKQPLTINEFSRPGEKVDAIEYIVIHYLGNPKTTAQQNHDYFESLKDLQDTSMSANYVVGIDDSCVHLAAYLAARYDIDREHIIRHYDVTGKECPLYYVEHEDKWEEFKDDVMNYIDECKKAVSQG